jgi:Nucleotidyl transferase AbiEii toxin, Type IV TA system
MAAGKFTKAAAALLRILGEHRCAIVGGLAVNAHGYVRATRDVDIMAKMPLAEARKLLRAEGVAARLFKGDARDGEFDCLKGVIGVGPRRVDGVPFDILPPLVPFEPERAVELTVRGAKLRVVDPDTLIRLKLEAGSAKDLYDVAILANLHRDWEERALALATASRKDVGQRLVSLLRDPRVRAQANEVARQDKALRDFARMRKRRPDRPGR